MTTWDALTARFASLEKRAIGYWPLKGYEQDHVSGHTVRLANGQPATYAMGKWGRCLEHNGDASSLPRFERSPLQRGDDYASHYTVSVWLRRHRRDTYAERETMAANLCICAHDEGRVELAIPYSEPVILSVQTDEDYGFRSGGTSDASFLRIRTRRGLAEDTWHHLAYGVRERQIRIFIDGELDSEHELPSGANAMIPTFVRDFSAPASACAYSMQDYLVLTVAPEEEWIRTLAGRGVDAPGTLADGAARVVPVAVAAGAILAIAALLTVAVSALAAVEYQSQSSVFGQGKVVDATMEVAVEGMRQKLRPYPVRGKRGDPGATKPLSRANLAEVGFSSIHVDLGGEGEVRPGGGKLVSGFSHSVNINAMETQSGSSVPIPNLLLICVNEPCKPPGGKWPFEPSLPFEDGTIDLLSIQASPFTSFYAAEFARCLKPDGAIMLWVLRNEENRQSIEEVLRLLAARGDIQRIDREDYHGPAVSAATYDGAHLPSDNYILTIRAIPLRLRDEL